MRLDPSMGARAMTNGLLAAVVAAFLTAAQTPAPTPVGLASMPPQSVEGTLSAPLAPVPAEGAAADGGAGPTAWITADYVLAWMRGGRLPPLVTTSPPGTAENVAGILQQPTTLILFQGGLNESARNGFRMDVGTWLLREEGLQIEAGGMVLASTVTAFSATSNGSTILARPYVNALTGAREAQLVAFPGVSADDINVRASSGNFYEAHVTLAQAIQCAPLEVLLGYRFYRFDEHLLNQQRFRPLRGPDAVIQAEYTDTDQFSTQNEFHGLDLGVRSQLGTGDLTIDLLAKVAVGQLRRQVAAQGNRVVTSAFEPPVTLAGGVYALSSNSITRQMTDWAALPELGAGLSYRVGANSLLHLGYSLLWLGGITRPGEAIDTTLNPNLFPPAAAPVAGPQRPVLRAPRSDVWIQSLNFGIVFTY